MVVVVCLVRAELSPRPPVCNPAGIALVAGNAPVKDILQQGRLVLADLGGAVCERQFPPEVEFDFMAFKNREMDFFMVAFMPECNGSTKEAADVRSSADEMRPPSPGGGR